MSEQFRDYYEERNAQKNINSDNPHSKELVKIVGEALDISSGDRVLDVGSADGYLLDRLLATTHYACGVGLDISDHSVALARRLVQSSRISFVQGSADALPFAAGAFDKIICSETIEHVPDDVAVLQELRRVCAPRGKVFVTAPNSFDIMLPLFKEHCRKVDEVEGHLRRYSAEQFERLARGAGFRVSFIRYNASIASFIWYAAIIYNQPLKTTLLRLITRKPEIVHDQAHGPMERPAFGPAAKVAFAMMNIVSALDRPLRSPRLNMGFYAVLEPT